MKLRSGPSCARSLLGSGLVRSAGGWRTRGGSHRCMQQGAEVEVLYSFGKCASAYLSAFSEKLLFRPPVQPAWPSKFIPSRLGSVGDAGSVLLSADRSVRVVHGNVHRLLSCCEPLAQEGELMSIGLGCAWIAVSLRQTVPCARITPASPACYWLVQEAALSKGRRFFKLRRHLQK